MLGRGMAVAAALAAGGMLATGQAAAAPVFNQPFAISTGSSQPAIAVDAAGNTVAAWADGPAVMAAFRHAGGVFGAPVILGPQGGGDIVIQVAFDAEGTANVVWTASVDETVRIVTRPPGGEFGAPAAIGSGANPGLGVDFSLAPNGAAAVVYQSFAGGVDGVRAVVRPAGGTFGPPERIAGGFPNDRPQVSVGADGTVAATWGRFTQHEAGFAIRPPGGAWSPEGTMGSKGSTGGLTAANVAVDQFGGVLGVFSDGDWRVSARYRPPGGEFGPAQQLEEFDGFALGPEFMTPMELAMDAQGDATILWLQSASSGGGIDRFYTARRPSGGAFGPAQALSQGDTNSARGRLAVAPDGTAIAAWRGPGQPLPSGGGSGNDFRERTQGQLFATVRSGPAWAPVQMLSSAGAQPAVGMGSAGSGAVTWIRGLADPACDQIEVSFWAEGAGGALADAARLCGLPPPDVTRPTVTLTGKSKQKPLKTRLVKLRVKCSEQCSGKAAGSLKLTTRRNGKKVNSTSKLKAVKFNGAAGKNVSLALRLSKTLADRVAKTLDARGSASLAVTAEARDIAKNPGTAKRTVKLVR